MKALHPDGGPLENVSDAFSELMLEGADHPFSRFTDRSLRVIAAAGKLSASQPVGPAQVTAALFAEPEALAAKAVTAAGVSPSSCTPRSARARAGMPPRIH